MKSYLAVCVLISLSVAAPISEDSQAQIISYENENDGLGNYRFSYMTSNGISRSETGRLVNAGEDEEHIEVQGEFSYTDSEGKLVTVYYTAGENGYQIIDSPPLPAIAVVSGSPPALVASLLG